MLETKFSLLGILDPRKREGRATIIPSKLHFLIPTKEKYYYVIIFHINDSFFFQLRNINKLGYFTLAMIFNNRITY